jgi:hypothetical protein
MPRNLIEGANDVAKRRGKGRFIGNRIIQISVVKN